MQERSCLLSDVGWSAAWAPGVLRRPPGVEVRFPGKKDHESQGGGGHGRGFS